MGKSIVFLTVVAVILMAPSVLYGQGANATIGGTVTDDTGAVLPGVEVTITHVDTGQTRLAITGETGRYTAPSLAVGSYQVRAELPGFQTAIRRGIRIQVGQEARVDLKLSVGEISEEVIVTSAAPLVNTTSATLGEVIDEVQVHELPLNSRNLSQLSLLTPGVVQLRTAITGGVIQGAAAVRVSVGGASMYSTGYLLDGTDVTDSSRGMGPSGAAGSMFGVETVKEFQVITNNYSAEYSRFSGGIMSMVTKTGTNDIHGSLFFFHRNDNLDATDFFTNKFALEKPEFRRHQFGATVGGPIVQDQTFFFVSYEGFREALGVSTVGLVPTPDAKRGIFPASGGDCSSSLAGFGGVYDAGLDRCILPINPGSAPILALFPDPNRGVVPGGITADYVANKSQPTTENFSTIRVDHNFSDSDSLFGRFTISKGDKDLVIDGQRSSLDSALTTVENLNMYSTLEWKHIFSPRTINTVRVGAQRNSWTEDCTFGGPLDIGFFPELCMGFIAPGNGIMHLGNWVVGQNISNQFSYGNDLFLTRGRHDMKLGFLLTRHQTNDFTFASGDGRYTFDSLAELVVGQPRQWDGRVPGNDPIRGSRQLVFGFYVQDDFKVTSNFTLNLGLRYEPTQSPTEVNGKLSNLRNPLSDTKAFIGEPFFNTPSKTNFAPRIGLAWDPFGDGKTSVRAGFGIFHETILPYHYSGQIRRSPPFAVAPVIQDSRCGGCVDAQFPRPPVEALNPVGGALDFQVAEFNPSQPYMTQWNLSLQREIGDITLTAAYVGSKGTHLQSQRNINARVPEILPDGRKLFRTGLPDRNPAWRDLDYWEFANDSHYNGLQLGARKRFSSGLQFQASYSYGRSTDNASSINQSDIQENTSKIPQDQYNVSGTNKGLSDHDVRNNFSFNYVYELPIHGIAGTARHFLEGWQMNGILQLSTGNPLRAIVGSGPNLTDYDRDGESGGGAQNPSLREGASNSPVVGDGRNPDQYYDKTAFVLHNPGFYGNVGRNTIIGPGVATFDFSLFKNTHLSEEVNLQFRAEFFNIFNRANFGTPDRNVFSSANITSIPCSTYGATGGDTGCSQLVSSTYRPTAGRITNSKTTNRQIQLGLRLVF